MVKIVFEHDLQKRINKSNLRIKRIQEKIDDENERIMNEKLFMDLVGGK